MPMRFWGEHRKGHQAAGVLSLAAPAKAGILLTFIFITGCSRISPSDLCGIWVCESEEWNHFLEIHAAGRFLQLDVPSDSPFDSRGTKGTWRFKGGRLYLKPESASEDFPPRSYRIQSDFQAPWVEPHGQWWRANGLALVDMNESSRYETEGVPFTRLMDTRSGAPMPDPDRSLRPFKPGHFGIRRAKVIVFESYTVQANPPKPVMLPPSHLDVAARSILAFCGIEPVNGPLMEQDAVLSIELRAKAIPVRYQRAHLGVVTDPKPIILYRKVEAKGEVVFSSANGGEVRRAIKAREDLDLLHKETGLMPLTEQWGKSYVNPVDAPWYDVHSHTVQVMMTTLEAALPGSTEAFDHYLKTRDSYPFAYWNHRRGERRDHFGWSGLSWFDEMVYPGTWRRVRSEP